jgi:hypothetical protein
MDLPVPQAPFPNTIPRRPEFDFKDRRITRTIVNKVNEYLDSNEYNLPGIISQFINHIDYTEGLARQFKDHYFNLLSHFFSYFNQLQFLNTSIGYQAFMEIRMLKYFDNERGNYIFNQVANLSNKNPENEYRFTILPNGICEWNSIKCDKVILMLVSLESEGENIGHRNLLEINQSTKRILIVDPNYDIRNNFTFDDKLEGYRAFFEPLGYNVNYMIIVRIRRHGGLCTLLSILNYYFHQPTFDYSFVREKFIEYLNWEHANMEAGVLTFGNPFDQDIKYLKSLKV